MGGFARVALPVAAAFAAPHLAGLLAPSNAAAGLIASEGIIPGATTFLSGATVPASAALVPTVSPLAVAKAGIAGLLDLNAQRRAEARHAFAQARDRAEAARLEHEFFNRERERRDRLRRAVAAERARLGAAGVSSVGGSGAAVVRGLMKNAEDEIRLEREALNSRRRSLLDASRPSARSGFTTLRNTLSPFVNFLD